MRLADDLFGCFGLSIEPGTSLISTSKGTF
jgi:hypothetical protein